MSLFKSIKTVVFSVVIILNVLPAVASHPGALPVPFERTDHGFVFSCPKVSPDQATSEKMKKIIKKINDNTLTYKDVDVCSLLNLSMGVQECDCLNYNRSSGLRTDFENNLSLILNKAYDKDRELQYVNYGAGLMFQDLIVATKLALGGQTKISVVLVDDYYKDFMKAQPSDQNKVHPLPNLGKMEQTTATRVNNAIYYLSSYFSLLQHEFPRLSISIKMFETYQKALAGLPEQSCQLIFYMDINPFEGMDADTIESSPILKNGTPLFSSPYQQNKTKQYVRNDYFTLASYVLAHGACNAAVTGLKYRCEKFEVRTPVFGIYDRYDKDLRTLLFQYLSPSVKLVGKNNCELNINDRFNVTKNQHTGAIVVWDRCNLYAPTTHEFVQKNPFWKNALDKGLNRETKLDEKPLRDLMLVYNVCEFGKHYSRLKKS